MALSGGTFVALVTLLIGGTSAQSTCPSDGSCDYRYTDVAILSTTNNLANTHYYLGGLFGVHERADDSYSCSSADIRDRGIINLEAFMWAIRKYSSISPNVSVGGVAFDSCSRPEQTIENVLSFETCKVKVGTGQNAPTPRSVLAYIGPDTSTDAMSSAMMLKDMKKTQISHAATSNMLSSEPYPYFLRTVPSDAYDFKIIASLIQQFYAKYVLVVYTGNAYGRDGFDVFKMETAARNICIAHSVEMPMSMLDNDLKAMSNAMASRSSARYIVVIATASDARTILEAMSKYNQTKFKDFVVIGTSSWTQAVVDNLEITSFHTSLHIGPAFQGQLSADMEEFYTYLDGLTVTQNTWNKDWFTDLRNTKAGCRTPDDQTKPLCNDSVTIKGRYQRDPFVPFTLAAVRAAITGIKDGASAACNTQDVCSAYLNQANRGQNIYNGILGASLGGSRYFNNQGDASSSLTRYAVYRVDGRAGQATTSTMIGTYNPTDSLVLTSTPTTWPSACPNDPCLECGESPVVVTTPAPRTTTMAPPSSTRDPTAGGDFVSVRFLQNYTFTGAYDASSISRSMQNLYADGIVGFIRDGTRFAIGQNWIIALGVLAGLGILSVIVFEVYILYKLLGTRIGTQWRTMWLGQLLLLGIFLSYLTLFAYLPIPTNATCGITRFGVGLCYSIMFAVLLVKLMVILTSKTSGEALIAGDLESPNYLKGIYQFLMFIFAVGVQVVINVQWLIQVPPYAILVTTNSGQKEWICNHYTWEAKTGWSDLRTFVRTPFENHLLSLIYIMILILMTTIVAMKAHGIITNHRESVFIGIAAGFSIPVWIAWGLVGGLNRDNAFAQEYGDACMAFGLFVTATLCLFAMFLPKVRQLVNMGVEGIYLEDDRDTYYAGSVVMGPPSYKSRPSSMVYVNQGDYSNPVVIGNGDPNHLKHQGSMYSGHSAPVYTKRSDFGSSKVLKVTGDLTGKQPARRPVSEVAYGGYAGSYRKTRSESGGTLRKARSAQDLGAL